MPQPAHPSALAQDERAKRILHAPIVVDGGEAIVENQIVHFEISADKGGKQALQEFYRTTFGWQVVPTGPMEYGLLPPPEDGGPGIGGAVDEGESGPGVLIYIGVDGITDYLAKAEANGATVVQPVTTIPGMVTMALFRDPAGNLMGIVENETPGE